jgi:o-succinylbenzoate---CoA ligase
MLFYSSEGDLFISEPNNDYYQESKKIIDNWYINQEFEFKTSGSTGEPKPYFFSKKQIEVSVKQTQTTFNLDVNTLFVCSLPQQSVAGKMMIYRALSVGADLIIFEPRSNPFMELGPQLHHFSKYSKNIFFAFSTVQIQTILKDSVGKEVLIYAKAILIGGSPIFPIFNEELINSKLPLFETYGMTETLTHIAYRKITDQTHVFKPLSKIKIRKNQNECLEIFYEGLNPEWISTNDLVEIYDNGTFKVLGRADRIINSGGIKLELDKIEQEMATFINSRFFLGAVQDPILGQKLVLLVEGPENKQLEQDLKMNLSKYHKPKELIFVPHFKETYTQKIDKLATINAFYTS